MREQSAGEVGPASPVAGKAETTNCNNNDDIDDDAVTHRKRVVRVDHHGGAALFAEVGALHR